MWMILFIVWLVLSTIGSMLSLFFMYTWGRGDADFGDNTTEDGDPAYNTGYSGDPWHRYRRKSFYPTAFFSTLFNPAGVVLLLVFGRRLFRMGVKKASPVVHERWFPEVGQ